MAAVPSAEMKPHSEPVEVTKVLNLDRNRADDGGEKQRQQELGPGEDEAEHRRGGDAAAHHRQHDLRKVCQRVAPSIIAASSTSFGTSSKKDFISRTAIGRFISA